VARRRRLCHACLGAHVFPYWLLFTLFAAGAVQYDRGAQAGPRSALVLGLTSLVIALMIGLRYQVGGDWEVYLYIFDENRISSFATILAQDDPGYNALNWLAARLGLEIWASNLVCGALFCWGLITFCKEQPNPWLAVVVAIPYLVIVVAMGYARQGVAIGIIMAAMVAWDKGRLIRFGVYVLVAATFHKTAVAILPLIAMSSTKNRALTGAGVLIFGVILYRSFLSDHVDRLVTNYVDAEYSSQGAGIRVAMNLVPAAIFLLLQKRFDLTPSQHRMWRYMSFAAFGTLLLLMLLASSTVVDRLALYLIPLQLFVFSRLPIIFGQGGRPNGQMTLLVVAYAALLQFVWLNFAYHAEYWLPYQLWPTEGAETTPKGDFF
jgi:hypothetical protein